MRNLNDIRFIRLVLLGLMVWGFQACQDDNLVDRDMENQRFVTEAASSNRLEVKAGSMAASEGQHPAVRAYGEMMVQDHSEVGADLTALTANKPWDLPTGMIQRHQDMIEDLEGHQGSEFDEEFVELMIASHEEAIALFENAARANQGVPDPDLRAFAAEKLPALRAHLVEAEELQEILDTPN